VTEEIRALYEKFRLVHYRELFGRIHEKDGSLSATEAFAADVIYLLKNPTVSQFADALGISQPNATYKINNLEAKGYVTRINSESDKRECRITVADRFFSYYDTQCSFIDGAVQKLRDKFTPDEISVFEKMLCALTGAVE
jgi:DNA-binding MarR family transcriptional regulator